MGGPRGKEIRRAGQSWDLLVINAERFGTSSGQKGNKSVMPLYPKQKWPPEKPAQNARYLKMKKEAPPLYGQSALLKNGRHGAFEKGTALGPAFDLVGGARGIRTAPRGTSRRRRLTEQVISPPALGESQRALTQGTPPGVLLRYPPWGVSAGPLSLIVSVACMEEHLARSGLSRHVTHPLPRRLLHPCVLRPAILKA